MKLDCSAMAFAPATKATCKHWSIPAGRVIRAN
jgi:hypothetical protein